ncbi:MAG: PLP-dependent aminotransferase family protein [Burkholderiales bacterium]
MFVKLEAGTPLYPQIYQRLRQAILAGELAAGARLPSSRLLAEEAGVSRNTVLLAYDQLLAEGYIRGRPGSGTYVASELPDQVPPRRAAGAAEPATPSRAARLSRYGAHALEALGAVHEADSAPRFDFRYGLPSVQDFPFFVWRKLLMRRLRRPTLASVNYAHPQGHRPLRAALADYLQRVRAVNCNPERIVVVNGSQQALDLISRVLLDPGDRVLIEDPQYLVARQVLLAGGAKLVPAPVDGEGLVIDRIPKRARHARLAYVTPSHQFPTGAVMPLSRRLALLAWAQRNGTYVIEDDYDSEYRYAGRPIEAVQALDRDGSVIYVGTLSKTMFPSMRVGYLVLPAQLVPAFVAAKFLADRHTPTLLQEVLADFIGEGHFERHLRRTRTRNESRRAALLAALRAAFGDGVEVTGSGAGLHMLVWLNELPLARLEELLRHAREDGIGVYPVAPCYLVPPRRAGLLLGYAALDEAEIRRGIERLGRIVAAMRVPQATRPTGSPKR